MRADEELAKVMTRELKTVLPKDSMQRVHHIFQSAEFHHLPVVNTDGKLVGLISKADYFQLQNCFTVFSKTAAAADAVNERLFSSLLVDEVMTTQLAVLKPTDTIAHAMGYLRENRFRAIPIVDDQQQLLGIVTPLDLLNFAFNEETLTGDAIVMN